MTFDPPMWLSFSSLDTLLPWPWYSPTVPELRWGGSRSQSVDQPQNLLEQFPRHHNLDNLEDIAKCLRGGYLFKELGFERLDLEKNDKQKVISTLEAILARLRGELKDRAQGH